MTRLLLQGYKVYCLSNTLKNCRHTTDLVGQYKKMSAKCLLILSVKVIFIFYGLSMAELIKLAKMPGVKHETEHVYSIWSTWLLHGLASDVPFTACVINSQLHACLIGLMYFNNQ